MKLPQSLCDSVFFIFSNVSELSKALLDGVSSEELALIHTLASKGLPPISSRSVLATMFGVSPGLVWSFENRTNRHYRLFSIPKGNSQRRIIQAPKVALKIVQKWLAVHLERIYSPPPHVFGFVKGRSHVMAADVHAKAKWVFSVDIRDFFQTTPVQLVADTLRELGYASDGARLIASLCCLNGHLAQGAPSSPVLSNLCFHNVDVLLLDLANKYGIRLTRYADDIVFSGLSEVPEGLKRDVLSIFEAGPWTLAEEKMELAIAPKSRLKVHGLLVHGDTARLTKGYRNRIRGFRHVLETGKVGAEDAHKMRGHLNYASLVQRVVARATK